MKHFHNGVIKGQDIYYKYIVNVMFNNYHLNIPMMLERNICPQILNFPMKNKKSVIHLQITENNVFHIFLFIQFLEYIVWIAYQRPAEVSGDHQLVNYLQLKMIITFSWIFSLLCFKLPAGKVRKLWLFSIHSHKDW